MEILIIVLVSNLLVTFSGAYPHIPIKLFHEEEQKEF